MAARRFEDVRAWQAARAFKLDVYNMIETGTLARHPKLSGQLHDAAAAAPSHISEGFGRFDPADFARFVKMARASILECRNHLQDAVDLKALDDGLRNELVAKSDKALTEIGGLLDYLHSPEAKRNAERIKQRRVNRYREGKPSRDEGGT